MKILEASFTKDDNQFTQLKRTDRAALYQRDTLEGHIVSYEVFAVLSNKNGDEIYPEKHAFSKWAWCPISLSRANDYFSRIDGGETVIPQVDPETSELIRDSAEISLDDMPDVNVSPDDVGVVPAPVVVPVAEVKTVVDPTAPDEVVEVKGGTTPEVSPVEVQSTPDGGAVVTVAKVTKTKTELVFNIPAGEFTQAQFAVANGLPERGVVWSRLDGLVKAGKLTKKLVKMGRGRPCQVFSEATV